jgi:HAD superfamily hydrolase (TIGR01509 family)
LDWDWTVALYGDLLRVTGGKERIRYFMDNYQPRLQFKGSLDRFVAELHAAKTKHFTDLLEEGNIPLRTGVARLLRQARDADLRLAIATTTTLENVEALLVNTLGRDALDWFELIAAGDIVPHKKPAPDIYFHTLERMRLQPHRCIAFEDSENGLKSSTGAGLPTIITVNEYTDQHDFVGALLVLDHLGEPDLPYTLLHGRAPQQHHLVDVALLQQLIG